MKRWFWGTAVFLVTLLLSTAGCGATEAEPAALPEINGPAFILFYTDN